MIFVLVHWKEFPSAGNYSFPAFVPFAHKPTLHDVRLLRGSGGEFQQRSIFSFLEKHKNVLIIEDILPMLKV